MASDLITSWQIDGKTMETVTDFIFLGSKITADVDCSHEIKRRLFLGRKAMTNIGSVLNSRGIALLTMVHLVKAMPFPVVLYECENWTIKHGPWSIGEGNGKPLQYSCLKNPMNSMKRQKYMIPEDKPSRSVGVQYATRKEWRRGWAKMEIMLSCGCVWW